MVSPTDFDRGLLNSRGLPLPPGPSLLWPRVSDIKAERLRTAASDLGKVYNALRKEDQSLGEWALPTKRTSDTGEPIIGYQLGNALEKAFAPEQDPQERFWRYADAFDIATSEIAPKAVDWARNTLKDQKDTLVALKQEIDKAEFAEWMHQAAKDITQSSAACRDAAASQAHSEFMQEHQGNPLPDRDLYTAEQSRKLQRSVQECWTQATKSFVEKEKGGKAAQAGYIDLLRILLFHQKYIDILNAYEQKPAQGTALAKTLIDDSLGAIDKFSAGLTAKKIWHYVAAVQGAVEALKLNDVSGFPPFMQNISAQLAKDPVDDILSTLGMGLFFVGLIPGVGVGFMVADVILNGATAWFSYLRNHEQELAARSSAFLPDESRFASSYGYGDTTLAAIFAFISVASLLRPAAKALKSARAKPVVPEGAPLRKEPPAPSAGTAQESKLVGNDAAALKNKALGDKATPGASQAGKPAQELAGAKPKGPAATPAAKGEPASTAPSAPAKDEVKAANGTANKLDQGKGTGPANKAVHRETAEGAKPPGEPPDKSGLGKMPSGLAKHAKLDEVVEQMLEDLPQLKGKLDTELVNKVLKHFDEDIPDVIVEIAKRNRKVEDAVRAVNELLEVAAETGEIENMSDLFHELAGVEAPKRAKMYKPLLGTGASARGADFEIEWVYHRQKTFKDVKRVGIKTVNGLKGADVQMTNGSIVELKNWKLDNFTGRFAEQKAKEIAGQALTRLKAKYSSVHFVFRGTPADMPQAFADALNKELDAVAKQSGLPRSNFGFSLWMP